MTNSFLSSFQYSLFAFGCLLFALTTLRLFWHLIMYAVSKDDDEKRTAAKKQVMRLSAYIALLMLLWWLCLWLAGVLPL